MNIHEGKVIKEYHRMHLHLCHDDHYRMGQRFFS